MQRRDTLMKFISIIFWNFLSSMCRIKAADWLSEIIICLLQKRFSSLLFSSSHPTLHHFNPGFFNLSCSTDLNVSFSIRGPHLFSFTHHVLSETFSLLKYLFILCALLSSFFCFFFHSFNRLTRGIIIAVPPPRASTTALVDFTSTVTKVIEL